MAHNAYTTTIGLEIHAELKTQTKMFCNSANDPDEPEPNVNVCPICLGHPGTLPVVNKEAVRHVLKVGTAVEGEIADFTEFDRKNYFYPDIPKGYQISQYKYPLVKGGSLAGVKLTRIHLEEDTGTSLHEEGDYSLLNYNRAGVPLMELVTEPVIHSGEEAARFAKELQLLLRYLGVADANMEKGEMRVEANISVSKTKEFGTKVEVKNLNSFKSVERAIEYEVSRHIELLESGERVIQETRGFNEGTGKTFSQRLKEDSHDYRYFPDPDIPKLKISEIEEFSKAALKNSLPELPEAKRKRYKTDFDIKSEDIEIFVLYCPLGEFFESVSNILKDKKIIKIAANYILSDLMGLIKNKEDGESEKIFENIKISPVDFAELITMISSAAISSRGAKDLLKIMYEEGGNPNVLAKERGLLQQSDSGLLKGVVVKVIEGNPKVVADYKAGKASALQFLLGQGMKETKGAANPSQLKKLFEEHLK